MTHAEKALATAAPEQHPEVMVHEHDADLAPGTGRWDHLIFRDGSTLYRAEDDGYRWQVAGRASGATVPA